jgi:endonuclease/exonuclease/phosphatase family metal-dependent hydrolase
MEDKIKRVIHTFICIAILIALFLAYLNRNSGHQKEGLFKNTNIMSINVRYHNPADGQNAWPFRKEKVAETIRFHSVDIAGLQEVLWDQLQDLETLLPEYHWFGVGRDDGDKQGEFVPVFYLKRRFRIVDHRTFWLSEFPDEPGKKGWDAACPRIVTWGQFEDIESGITFYVFNTHFDHRGERARAASAKLVLDKVHQIAGNAKVILTGDFNSTVRDSAYILLTQDQTPYPSFTDTFVFPGVHLYGGTQTYTGFQEEIRQGYRIDYIFVKNIEKVFCLGILPERWDGMFISDHNPVMAQILIEP